MCNINPIRTDADFAAAEARLYALRNAEPGTPAGDEYELLADLVELYDNRHYPIAPPAPDLAADIEFWMDRQGWTPQQVNALLGPGWDIAAVLAGQQAITIPMAQQLHQHLEIRPASLLQAMFTGASAAVAA